MARKPSRKPVAARGAPRRRAIVQQAVGRLPASYTAFLEDLKARIRVAQVKASLSANRELIALYWGIGRDIAIKERTEGWGAKLIDRLGDDLQRTFRGLGGFSRTNVYNMRAFYLAYSGGSAIVQQAVGQLREGIASHSTRKTREAIVPQPVGQWSAEMGGPEILAQIPWGHNVTLIEKVKDPATRLWYARQAVAHGWSRNILSLQIESGLHERQGRAITNFKTTLVPPQSELAQQVLKDPYLFDFLTISEDAEELSIERDLVTQITRFLLEMGAGFAFVGRQVHVAVGGDDFYIDLLFYHLRLRCYVVLDLKAKPFKPEFVGKMNFYLSAVDDLLRHPEDKPSIGLILCHEKNRITAEYALRDVRKPIGVAGWQAKLTETLPKRLRGSLPSIQQLEKELKGARGHEARE